MIIAREPARPAGVGNPRFRTRTGREHREGDARPRPGIVGRPTAAGRAGLASLWPGNRPSRLHGVRARGAHAPDRAPQSVTAVRASRPRDLLPERPRSGVADRADQPGPVHSPVPDGLSLERFARLAGPRHVLRARLCGADRDPAPPAGHASQAARQRGPAAGGGPAQERVPRDARARAAQSARADSQHRSDSSRARLRAVDGPADERSPAAAGLASRAPRRRPAGRRRASPATRSSCSGKAWLHRMSSSARSRRRGRCSPGGGRP